MKVGFRMKNIGTTAVDLGGLVVNAYGVKYAALESEHLEKPLNGVVEISRALVPGKPSLQYAFADTWKAFGSRPL